MFCSQNRVDGLYIVLISMHGLIRGQHMELGRDADTGGQVCFAGMRRPSDLTPTPAPSTNLTSSTTPTMKLGG